MPTFSKRYGHKGKAKEITIRDGAPAGLRDFIIQSLYAYGYSPSTVRLLLCRMLRVGIDPNNWSESNIASEITWLILNCEWYRIYDFIETLNKELLGQHSKQQFEEELNEYFIENGIGWKMKEGVIEFRGEESFEKATDKALEVMEAAEMKTASREMREALLDLSRRPEPDLTGALHHALACLECICREITGDKNATVGELMKKFDGKIPPPLDQAISKIWGFSSEQGRHIREGGAPQFLETELVVGLAAEISQYLTKKHL